MLRAAVGAGIRQLLVALIANICQLSSIPFYEGASAVFVFH
jgi:hypothetical protein